MGARGCKSSKALGKANRGDPPLRFVAKGIPAAALVTREYASPNGALPAPGLETARVGHLPLFLLSPLRAAAPDLPQLLSRSSLLLQAVL